MICGLLNIAIGIRQCSSVTCKVISAIFLSNNKCSLLFWCLIGILGNLTKDEIVYDLSDLLHKIGDVSEMVPDNDSEWMTNRKKWYVLYQIVLLPMILSDTEGHFSCIKDF